MKHKGFLTVVETVYHQLIDGQPTGEPNNFQVPLVTEEQPFSRRVVIDDKSWRDVASLGCWLKDASYVRIANEQGSMLKRYPTPDEAAVIAKSVIEVRVGTGSILVRPGTSCRFEPADLDEVRIMCRNGSALLHVTVFPR